jgi:hypothetical protein
MSVYITLAEAKTHCRVDFLDDDIYIQSLCNLAEALVLTEIQGSIDGEGTVTTAGTTALVGVNSNFTDYIVGDTITVDGETIRTIATITDDTHLTVGVAFATSESELTYIMHPGIPTTIPLGLKQAMLLLVGHYYLIREPVMVGIGVTEIPFAYKYLIAPWKNWTIK